MPTVLVSSSSGSYTIVGLTPTGTLYFTYRGPGGCKLQSGDPAGAITTLASASNGAFQPLGMTAAGDLYFAYSPEATSSAWRLERTGDGGAVSTLATSDLYSFDSGAVGASGDFDVAFNAPYNAPYPSVIESFSSTGATASIASFWGGSFGSLAVSPDGTVFAEIDSNFLDTDFKRLPPGGDWEELSSGGLYSNFLFDKVGNLFMLREIPFAFDIIDKVPAGGAPTTIATVSEFPPEGLSMTPAGTLLYSNAENTASLSAEALVVSAMTPTGTTRVYSGRCMCEFSGSDSRGDLYFLDVFDPDLLSKSSTAISDYMVFERITPDGLAQPIASTPFVISLAMGSAASTPSAPDLFSYHYAYGASDPSGNVYYSLSDPSGAQIDKVFVPD